MKQIIVNLRVNEGERAMIEKAAKQDDMSVSDYIRSAIYFERLMAGDLNALRLLSGRAKEKILGRISKGVRTQSAEG